MSKSIQEILEARKAHQQAIAPTEYSNYEEYMDAQSKLTQRLINQPAKVCELCGYDMDHKGHKLSEKEKKWSIHDVCRRKLEKQLDRDTGIATERRGKRVNTV